MDLTHLHIHVRDRERSEAFYRRWFGLQVTQRGDDITFMQGDRGFLFALMQDSAPADMPPWFHFGIRLDSAANVRATLDAMTAAQVPIVRQLHENPALVSFRCADPDAYKIEIYWAPA